MPNNGNQKSDNHIKQVDKTFDSILINQAINISKSILQQLKLCSMDEKDKSLNSIFTDLNTNKALDRQLKKIQQFYRCAFKQAPNDSAGCTVIKEYSDLIERIEKVKCGNLTATQAIEEISNSAENKRINIIIENVLKACELLFWTASAAVFYVGCVTVGIPMMLCEPIIGSAIFIGCTAFLSASFVSAIECFEQLKSFDHINKEERRELNLISFFSAEQTNQSTRLPVEKYPEEQSDDNSLTPTPVCI